MLQTPQTPTQPRAELGRQKLDKLGQINLKAKEKGNFSETRGRRKLESLCTVSDPEGFIDLLGILEVQQI